MYSILLRSAFSMLIVMISICCTNNVGFAQTNEADLSTHPSSDAQSANGEDKQLKYLQQLSEMAIDMLIALRGVIAKNQELINRDPATGNYSVKGFVPAVVGSQVANDFSLMTGHRLKQTSLKIRNPSNAPDEWERRVLKMFESSEHPKDASFGEILGTNGKRIYRYMKPIYIETACLQCHGRKEKILPAIRQFLERRYPFDDAFGYREGDLRGGISMTISLENIGFQK